MVILRSDVATGVLCSLGYYLMDNEKTSLYNVGKRVGASVGGNISTELKKYFSLKIEDINLPLGTKLTNKDISTGLIGSGIGLVEGESVKKSLTNSGLRLMVSSMVAREGMKILGIEDKPLIDMFMEVKDSEET